MVQIMSSINPAYLAFLRVLCERGSAPVRWEGCGRDDSLPEKVAKRLEGAGYIRRDRHLWKPTPTGLHAVGRVT